VSGSSQVVRVPDRVLRAPDVGSLPEPMPLRRMVGPSVILVGLSIGSGEFVLWPRLTAEWGFALFWACWVGLTLQFFLNMEIERWTLATGESAVVGFVRLHRVFGPVAERPQLRAAAASLAASHSGVDRGLRVLRLLQRRDARRSTRWIG
jgi:hypothetical protein